MKKQDVEMGFGARIWACIVLIAALVGCGGGGSGGSGGDGTLHVTVDVGGDLYLFRPASVQPHITGLQGQSPSCVLKSGSLPAGVSLNRDCSVTGTPAELGVFRFIVDFGASNASNHLDVYAGVTVFGPTTIYSPSNRIVVGEAVDWPTLNNFWTPGPQDRVAYTVDGGSLPPGLVLDPTTGRIHGVPTAEGAYSPLIGVTVSSSAGTTHAVSEAPLLVNVGGLDLRYGPAGGFVGFPMRATVTGLQAGATYSFAWDDSRPPPNGLDLDPATGTITGTLTELVNSATYRVRVAVQNQGREVSGSLLFSYDAGLPLYMRQDCFGTTGVPVRCAPSIYANGGVNLDGASYRFVAIQGYLPGFITLDPDTGVLAGTSNDPYNNSVQMTVTVTLNGISFDMKHMAMLTLY